MYMYHEKISSLTMWLFDPTGIQNRIFPAWAELKNSNDRKHFRKSIFYTVLLQFHMSTTDIFFSAFDHLILIMKVRDVDNAETARFEIAVSFIFLYCVFQSLKKKYKTTKNVRNTFSFGSMYNLPST